MNRVTKLENVVQMFTKVAPKISVATVFTLNLCFSISPKMSPHIWASFPTILSPSTFKNAQSGHTGREQHMAKIWKLTRYIDTLYWIVS